MAKKKIVNVKHLSKLSNLPVTSEEVEQYQDQFIETLEVISQLEELDTQGIHATPQVTGLNNRYRQDVIDNDRLLSQEEALSNAKKQFGGYFLVDAILVK